MRFKIPGIAVFLTLLVVFACKYTLDDEIEHVVAIDPVNPRGTIVLDNYEDGDTIYLVEPTYFSYQVDDAYPQASPRTEVYLGSTRLATSASRNGNFFIERSKIIPGTYTLKIVFRAASGSGSLADIFSNESTEIWKTWTVNIDTDPPPVPVITTSIENGFLKISWSKYEKGNFEKYVLQFQDHPVLGVHDIQITDPSKNSFVDSTYVIGTLKFAVIVYNKASASFSDLRISNPQAFTMVYHPEDSTAEMSWRKVNYPGPFKSFVISEKDVVKKTITSPTDTTQRMQLDVVFPFPTDVTFQLFDMEDREQFKSSEHIDNPANAPQTLANHKWAYNSVRGMVTGFGGGQVKLMNSSMSAVETFTVGEFSMPWPGRYMYYSVRDGVTQRDMVTGDTKMKTLFGVWAPTITPRSVSGADNQLATYEFLDTFDKTDQRYVEGLIDMSTNAILRSSVSGYDPKTTNFFLDILSDDGRYLWDQNPPSLCSVSGATKTKLGNLLGVGTFRSFRPDNNDEVILSGVPTRIIRTTDLALLRTIGPPEPGFTMENYDPVSKHILYSRQALHRSYVVNIETGEWKLVPANATNSTLINGLLISPGGYYVKVL